ncbi:hypothetical protein BCR32DRAFT_302928 [Anaeromyces robustus]|uniref:Uncharacterized protein n=1 Tax=Anaeromyces robustus TaxID=1754192 RepID=A0A1Y1WV68_9FUNG|nr:hypothetical protein BCR32DRAFT_302928 [Anaeromyces robustus]|eukprot:ORX77014.1 hypothetical protein BCR32DRAFT_302928 [Anaeromyces robustus]
MKNMTEVEINTKLFYEEINNNCNPEKLLEIAKKGIFLYEPLFKNEKVKNLEVVIEISIYSSQFFMVNTIEQYNKFIHLLNQKEVIIHPFNDYNIVNLLIINKYLLIQLLKEEDINITKQVINNFPYSDAILYYLYKFNLIPLKYYRNFYIKLLFRYDVALYVNGINYFYFNKKNNFDNVLNYFSKNELITFLFYYFGRDLKVLDFIVRFIGEIPLEQHRNYRVPLTFPYEIIKRYTKKIFQPNKTVIEYHDKKIEEFMNNVFTDQGIRLLSLFVNEDQPFGKYISRRYNINININYEDIKEKYINNPNNNPISDISDNKSNLSKKDKAFPYPYIYLKELYDIDYDTFHDIKVVNNEFFIDEDILNNLNKFPSDDDFYEKKLDNDMSISKIKVKLIYPIPLGSEIGSAFALLGCPTVLSALTFLERLVLNLLNNICCLLQTTGMISFNRAADRNKNGDFE